ncbi:MAG: TetR/AcrR family transcriptional regulator [Novosphingobium sp.]
MIEKPYNQRREDRRHAILDAAESLFLQQGFDRVSLNAIVQRSGGSLATVYAIFGNKHGLLHAVMDRAREEGLRELAELIDETSSPAAILRDFGLRYHQFITQPRTVALTRLVIAQSLNDAEYGCRFIRDIQLRFVKRMAEVFSRWTTTGQARIDRPHEAAELFIALVQCDAPVRTMLGMAPEPTDAATLNWRLAPFLEHFQVAS